MEEEVKKELFTLEELTNKFLELTAGMFRMDEICKVERIGFCGIRLTFTDRPYQRLSFIYYSDDNWNIGTKTWRNPPRRIQERSNKMKKEER